MSRIPFLILVWLSALLTSQAFALTVATYNTKYLSACVNYKRSEAFQTVVDHLRVDVVALQEVRDRSALELFFPTETWAIVFEDASTDDQNLAFAVRRHTEYRLLSGNREQAASADFLFPGSKLFTDRRDVLAMVIRDDTLGGEVLLLNHHAKSRYGGRRITETVRTEQALAIVDWIANSPFRDRVILLGDFNDTPDDLSVNSLEAGSLASQLVENVPGPFLVNLAEPLLFDDRVSYGLNSRDVQDQDRRLIESSVPGSRQANLDAFAHDIEVSKALYDQVLVSPRLVDQVSARSAQLYPFAHAVVGNSDTRASDHIPVVVAFAKPPLTIEGVLPDPVGHDHNKESIVIGNPHPERADRTIRLRDESGHWFTQSISVPGLGTATVIPTGSAFSLNNSGDTLELWLDGRRIDRFEYLGSQEGALILKYGEAATGGEFGS